MENMYHLVFYFKQLRVLEQTTKTQLFPSSFSSIRWRCVLVITKKKFANGDWVGNLL